MSDALLVIDPQNDFCEGGRLAVAGGAGIMPLINRLSARFDRVIVTQDWHTPDQISFASNHPGAAPFARCFGRIIVFRARLAPTFIPMQRRRSTRPWP